MPTCLLLDSHEEAIALVLFAFCPHPELGSEAAARRISVLDHDGWGLLLGFISYRPGCWFFLEPCRAPASSFRREFFSFPKCATLGGRCSGGRKGRSHIWSGVTSVGPEREGLSVAGHEDQTRTGLNVSVPGLCLPRAFL